MDILKEAERLYNLGFGIHWIKPNSKAPVKSGWAGPKRDPWDVVKNEYTEGYGLGVRLGESSNLGNGYLANIDIDIKSSDPRHKQEAFEFARSKFPDIFETAPVVATGYGYRLFVKTPEPMQSQKLGSSSDNCVVYMPTAEVNPQQLKYCEEGLITRDQLKRGFRVRKAWEVEFMSAGKQVVLPPSTHPETKKPYLWQRPIKQGIPEVHVNGQFKKASAHNKVIKEFKPTEDPDLNSRLPSNIVDMIESGEGVTDRSAALLLCAKVMLRHNFTEDEVLTVLTDRDYALGMVAYEHRNTESRSSAAWWLSEYTLKKAVEETNPSQIFDSIEDIAPATALDAEGQKAQQLELFGATLKKNSEAWRSQLDRTEKGALRQTLKNVVLFLVNTVSPELFKRDLFANRDFYGVNTPWGGEVGVSLTDDDAIRIKFWLAETKRFEPSVNLIYEAMAKIATDNAYHPIREELLALPPWDGVPRIDTWFAKHFQARAPSEYLAQVFRKWLVASVTRTFEPGAKFDWLIIFEGPQGIGKSMFGSILFGQNYFTDWLPKLDDKDAALGLQGKRCVEFGELDHLRKNEVDTIKAFVSRQIDTVRPPYGRRTVELRRQSVFIGSTNREHYLKDDTGNRRFNPVVVGALDFAALERDRTQLWAEALFIYENGFETTLELEGEAKAYALEVTQQKIIPDDASHMADELVEFYESEMLKPKEEQFKFERFKLKELFGSIDKPFTQWKGDTRDLMNASRALKLLNLRGFESHRYKSDGVPLWILRKKWGD